MSDLHYPFCHPDTVAFLRAIKNKYNPDKVVSLGDEVDFHGINFHYHDPDLPSPGDELNVAIKRTLLLNLNDYLQTALKAFLK